MQNYIEPESVKNYKWRFLVNPYYWISVIIALLVATGYYGILASVGYPDILSCSLAFVGSMTIALTVKNIFGWW